MNLEGFEFIHSTVPMPMTGLHVCSVVASSPAGRVLLSPSSVLTKDQLASAGALTDIVSPNLHHGKGVKAAVAAHPNARAWAPEGMAEKRPDVQWKVLGKDPWPYEDVLRPFFIEGMAGFDEWVFLHPESRTLFVGDLAFNMVDAKGLGAKLIFSMFGTYRRFAVSRLFMRYVTDRAQFTESMKKLAALDFVNVVPSHGQPVLGDAKERLLASLRERKIAV